MNRLESQFQCVSLSEAPGRQSPILAPSRNP